MVRVTFSVVGGAGGVTSPAATGPAPAEYWAMFGRAGPMSSTVNRKVRSNAPACTPVEPLPTPSVRRSGEVGAAAPAAGPLKVALYCREPEKPLRIGATTYSRSLVELTVGVVPLVVCRMRRYAVSPVAHRNSNGSLLNE